MGTATEKLRFLFESSGAHSVVGDFKKIDDAGGNTATKIGGVGSALQGLGGAAVLGGIGAVAGAAFAAAGKFEHVAIAAGQFSEATGVAVEDASRWIEVAGDMNIETGALEGALGKFNKTIAQSPEKLKALGVEVRRNKDGAVDVNETFLALVDRLNGITDPAKRAQVAAATLGKGWQSLAELIGEGSDKIRTSLAEVSDAKVITPQELANAKKYRDAIKDLGDAWEDFVITIGQEAAPALGTAAKGLVYVAKAIEVAAGATDSGYRRLSNGKVVLAELAEAEQALIDAQNDAQAAQDAGTLSLGNYTTAAESAAAASKRSELALKDATSTGEIYGLVLGGVTDDVNEWADATDQANEKQRAMKNAARAATDAIKEQDRAWGELTDAIGDDEAWLNLQEQADAVGEAVKKAFDKKHTVDDVREAEHAVNALKEQVAGYGREVLGIPPEQVTTMFALIDQGSLDAVIAQLATLTRNRDINLSIQARGGVGYGPRTGGPRAAGGPVSPGGTYLVGENGPELLQMGGQGGNVIPNGALGGTLNVHVHISSFTPPNPIDTGRVVADVLSKFIRSGGRVPGVQLSGTNNN